MIKTDTLNSAIETNVKAALLEDVGSGDITASLIPTETQASASVISRESAILCGSAWVNQVFQQIDWTLVLNHVAL